MKKIILIAGCLIAGCALLYAADITGQNKTLVPTNKFLDLTGTVDSTEGTLFVEYKTKTVKQNAPDGTIVDRFRSKSNTLGAGVSYHF